MHPLRWCPIVFLALISLSALAESTPPRTVRVAAVQCSSVFGRPEENRRKLEGLVRRAAGGGAKIVVLPETAVTGYLRFDLKVAWGLPGRALSDGLVGVDPKPFAETVPGKSTESFGRLGLLICYDIHKQAEVMSRQKVHTLLYAIAWVDDEGSDWFAKRLPAIAKKNHFNVVGANWTVPRDPKPTWHGYGQSLVIDRTGKVLAKAGDDLADEIVYADLPLSSWSTEETPMGSVGPAPARGR